MKRTTKTNLIQSIERLAIAVDRLTDALAALRLPIQPAVPMKPAPPYEVRDPLPGEWDLTSDSTGNVPPQYQVTYPAVNTPPVPPFPQTTFVQEHKP